MINDQFQARTVLSTLHGEYVFYRLARLEEIGVAHLDRLPFSIRIMLEALMRQCNGVEITRQDVINLAGWQPIVENRPVIPFQPGSEVQSIHAVEPELEALYPERVFPPVV